MQAMEDNPRIWSRWYKNMVNKCVAGVVRNMVKNTNFMHSGWCTTRYVSLCLLSEGIMIDILFLAACEVFGRLEIRFETRDVGSTLRELFSMVHL